MCIDAILSAAANKSVEMALGLVTEIPVSTHTSVAFGKNGYLFVSSNDREAQSRCLHVQTRGL